MSGPKEKVYDDEIAPLVRQVIAICKRAGIPVHAAFALDGDMMCTTHVTPERKDIPGDDLEAYDAWREWYGRAAHRAAEQASSSPLAITVRDSSGHVVASEVIL